MAMFITDNIWASMKFFSTTLNTITKIMNITTETSTLTINMDMISTANACYLKDARTHTGQITDIIMVPIMTIIHHLETINHRITMALMTTPTTACTTHTDTTNTESA